MSDILCIRFRDVELSPLSSISWVVLSPAAEIQHSGHSLLQDLSEHIPAKSGARKTILIAPTESLLLTKVMVPDAQRRHLGQVLPFIVEEQIIDPIEDMHLVVPKLSLDENLAVGCVRKDRLEHWLALFKAVEIEPDRLIADALCVPRNNGDWQLLFDQQQVLLRQYGGVEGMSLAPKATRAVLEIMLNQASESDALDATTDTVFDDSEEHDSLSVKLSRPGAVALYCCDEEPLTDLHVERERLLAEAKLNTADGEAANDVEAVVVGDAELGDVETGGPVAGGPVAGGQVDGGQVDGVDVNDFRKEIAEFLRSENIDGKLVDLAETATEVIAITAVREQDNILNFLQGEFTPFNENATTRTFIKRVSMACAACLALFLVVTMAGGFYLNVRADGYYDKSVAIYKELFPKQRRVRDPVRQMKSQLRGGSVASTVSDFLPLLDVASKSLQKIEEQNNTDTTIRQLRYDAQRGSISMELRTSNIDELESYRDLLSSEGLSVDILSANQDEGSVNGRLQIGRS